MGIKISVNKVLKDNPPITVIANGAAMLVTYCTFPMARGIMATIVVMAVIRIGLNRALPAIIRARDRRNPLCRNILVKSIKIIPLLTTIPSRMRKPIKVLAFNKEGNIASWLNGFGASLLIFWGYFQFRDRKKKER